MELGKNGFWKSDIGSITVALATMALVFFAYIGMEISKEYKKDEEIYKINLKLMDTKFTGNIEIMDNVFLSIFKLINVPLSNDEFLVCYNTIFFEFDLKDFNFLNSFNSCNKNDLKNLLETVVLKNNSHGERAWSIANSISDFVDQLHDVHSSYQNTKKYELTENECNDIEKKIKGTMNENRFALIDMMSYHFSEDRFRKWNELKNDYFAEMAAQIEIEYRNWNLAVKGPSKGSRILLYIYRHLKEQETQPIRRDGVY